MNPSGNQRRNLAICILLIVVSTLTTFCPVLKNEFINYDDPDYVTANEVVKQGLTAEGFKWAFTTGHASNWHPMTWLSHMADVSMFGLNPMGHHATNLFFHVVNSVLLLLLLWQMTGSVWRSAMVSALFALHPLHVESVAWVAERKDVLSAFFGILTLMAYAHYAAKAEGRWQKPAVRSLVSDIRPLTSVYYWFALGLFALGLMSKPMLVTWPFVMLLLDFWPLNRVTSGGWQVTRKTWGRLALEKLPFLLLAATSSAITLAVQQGAMAKTEIVPIGDRFCNAVLACAKYLQQTAWPAKMAVFYPFPTSFPTSGFVIASVILVSIFALAIRCIRSQPFVIVGWLWFVGTLVPVIGIVQVGAQARADRYTYLPLIGIFFAMSWGLHWLITQKLRAKPLATATAVVAMLIALGITSHRQLQHWQNDRALCSHAANVTTDNYVAWGGLGIIDVKAGDWPNAMTNLMRAYEYAKPHHTERSVSYYVGVALQMQGKPKEALPYLETCIVSAEMKPERDHRLGLSLMDAGRMTEAEAAIRSALAAKPQNLDYNLGMAALLMAKGDTVQAEPIYTNVVVTHSNLPASHKAYGDYLSLTSRHNEAEPRYALAVKLKQDSAPYRKAYANSLQRNGRFDLAVEQYEKAFALAKPTTQEELDLADIYAQLGQTQKVLACYDKAIEQEPNSVLALNNLAWLLATCPDANIRNGTRATELAERACRITEWRATVLMGTLAAAYAEAGRFPDAIAMAEKAIAKARDEKQENVAKRNGELLELYRSSKPYREK